MSTAAQQLVRTGFFGKVSSHGDFVHREVRDEFLNTWDAWLQRVITGSMNLLGSKWMDGYLTSPIWRFTLSSGTIDGAVWAGILMPGVDRVGRYFPLTIVGEFLPQLSAFDLAAKASAWFAQLEELALVTLDSTVLELNEWAKTLASAAGLVTGGGMIDPAEPGADAFAVWCWPLADVAEIGRSYRQIVEAQALLQLNPVTLWWTSGSDAIAPVCRVLRGLPDAVQFAEMLVGDIDASADDGVAPRQAYAMTHPGYVRSINQDAWMDEGLMGCWAVADGLGGHSHGEVASKIVVDCLRAALRPTASFEEKVQSLHDALQTADRSLKTLHHESGEACNAASTVVVLALAETTGAVIWAGDSRLYRSRQGDLAQITRDHVEASDSLEPHSPGEILRAVGGAETLVLDAEQFDVWPGDRFLLCSDGVHSALSDAVIADIMKLELDAEAICERLQSAVLAGPAADNLTSVVVVISAGS